MKNKICIAGKNNIAVHLALHILTHYKEIELVVIFNKNDDGINGFQRSFRAFCKVHNIKEVSLEDIYDDEDLIFLSLEFDRIVKPHLFRTAALFNIHFSLLPAYKGMFTSALPILYGENITGVSFHTIDRGIDTGDIIGQTSFAIDDSLKSEELYELYIHHGTQLVIGNLQNVIDNTFVSKPQVSEGSSYFSAKTIDYRNLIIDLNKTAYQIKRQINAFVFPAYQLPKVNGYEIYDVEVLSEKSDVKAGQVIEDTTFYLVVSTIDYNIKLLKDLRQELFEVAKNGNVEILINFISNAYNISQRSKQGWDIAIIAAYNNQFEFLEYLVSQCNWNINTINNNGTTLAMYLMTKASEGTNIDYLERFVNQRMPDLSIKDYHDKDIFEYAQIYNNQAVIAFLNQYK